MVLFCLPGYDVCGCKMLAKHITNSVFTDNLYNLFN